jgi:hypothetical protein
MAPQTRVVCLGQTHPESATCLMFITLAASSTHLSATLANTYEMLLLVCTFPAIHGSSAIWGAPVEHTYHMANIITILSSLLRTGHPHCFASYSRTTHINTLACPTRLQASRLCSMQCGAVPDLVWASVVAEGIVTPSI